MSGFRQCWHHRNSGGRDARYESCWGRTAVERGKIHSRLGPIDHLLLQRFRNFGSCHSEISPTAHQDFGCLDRP
jgi:hypothetical protein